MINELLKNVMNLGIITEDDVKRLTAIELMMLIIERTNGLLNHVEMIDDKLVNLLENVRTTTIEELNKWNQDGTFDVLINQSALKKVNDRIDETNARLTQKANEIDVLHLRDRLNEFEDSGVSAEAIQNKITSMVENGTISLNVVSKDMTNFMETGKNKFNKDDVVVGHIDETGSIYNEDEASKNYRTSQFIYIGGASSVTISPRLRKAMLYDENKTPIPSTYVDSSSNLIVFPLTITISDTKAKYLRITVADNDKDEVQVEIGASATEYERFWCDFQNRRPIALSEVGFCKNEYNKFNKKVVEAGYLHANGNIYTEDEISLNFSTSDYIRIKKGGTYNISYCRKFLQYTLSKSPLTATFVDSNNNNYIHTFTATSDGYIRFSLANVNLDKAMVINGDLPSSYEPFVKRLPETIYVAKESIGMNELSVSVRDKLISPLVGKKILNLGDSIAAGDGNNFVGYAHLIADRNDATCISYALGGARIGQTISNNIPKQLAEAISDGVEPDYIIFNGGTNDITPTNTPIGTITAGYDDNLDLNTFSGAFEHICKTCKTQFPSAKLLYVRVHNMSTRWIPDQKEYGERAIEICKKWSVPFVDLFNEGGLNTNIPAMKTGVFGTDATHPNEYGYLTYYIPVIEAKLNSI